MAQDINEATRVMGAPPSVEIDKTFLVGDAPPSVAQNQSGNATQMGATVVCPVCSTNNPGLEAYCGECGFLLSSTPGKLDEASGPAGPVFELVETASGRQFTLHAGENSVGRERADILLMDSTVSRRHAKITIDNGLAILMDLGSSNGTQIDGSRIGPNQPMPLASGATLRFGNAVLQLSITGDAQPARPAAGALPAGQKAAPAVEAAPRLALPGADSSAAPPPSPAIITTAPEAAAPAATAQAVAQLRPTTTGADPIFVKTGTLTIGRRSANDVVITGDPYISGNHAEILCDATGCYLSDKGSTNGTVVNGEKLEANKKQLLLDGDEVRLGQCTYVFETLEAQQ